MPKPHKIHYETAYVVRFNRARRLCLIFGVLLAVVLVPLVTYYGTLWYAAKENVELADKVSYQAGVIQTLEQKVANLEQLNTNADLSSEVDTSSLEQMRKDMVASQAQIEMLNEQIRFYQSLMDPNPDKGGIYIETVDIEAANLEGAYRYNIIIAQRSSNHQKVKGRVDVEFISERNSEEVQTFALSELTQNGNPLPLGFKFFQQLDGDITLPDGFSPTKVRVTVRLDGDSSPRLDETYAWKS